VKKGIKDTIMYDEKAVNERFGFGPLLIPDYKGLRGDPSDNIPGIKGIGEKTATTLVTTFGTIEDMYKELESGEAKFTKAIMSPRIIQLLKDNKEEPNLVRCWLLSAETCLSNSRCRKDFQRRIGYEEGERALE